MIYNITNRIIYKISILIFSIIIFQSCATKYKFATSPVVPAATGEVKVKKDNNNNYNIDLSVTHLADPKRLTPSREMYVVWMETERDGTKNIGQLNTSSGFLSSTMKSSLKTVSTFKPIGFLITAEDNATTQFPGTQLVLRTN